MVETLLERQRQIVREEVAALGTPPPAPSPWLDVAGAAEYLVMTEAAVRAAARRNQLPHTKTPLGQLRFDRGQLDLWVRGEVVS
jgi:hypothetical protein